MEKRYSDSDLAEFKALVEKKMNLAKDQVRNLEEQIKETTEATEDDFGTDIMDDSSFGSQLDFLSDMLLRQRKHLTHLENALKRIENKTYGICVVTGELIDKRRLFAVPTTTKSLQAKTNKPIPPLRPKPTEEKEEEEKSTKAEKKYTPKIITKIVKKPVAKDPNVVPVPEDDDDYFDEDDDLLEEVQDEDIDFDQIAAEDD